MGKQVRVINEDEYKRIIQVILTGFSFNGVLIKPNTRIAMVLTSEALLGIRIGDVLNLRLDSFKYESGKCHIDIIEQKTGKRRRLPVPLEVYFKLHSYSLEWGIAPHQKLFEITPRTVQRHLQKACRYLELSDVSTHSFRKFFATNIYEISGHDTELVRKLLQHSSLTVTQRYLGVQEKEVESVLEQHCQLIV